MTIFSISNIASGARVLKVQRPVFAAQVDFKQLPILGAICHPHSSHKENTHKICENHNKERIKIHHCKHSKSSEK